MTARVDMPPAVLSQATESREQLLAIADPLWHACSAYRDLTAAVEVLGRDYWDVEDLDEWSRRVDEVRTAAGVEDLYQVLSAFAWFIETAGAGASTDSPRTLLELRDRFAGEERG